MLHYKNQFQTKLFSLQLTSFCKIIPKYEKHRDIPRVGSTVEKLRKLRSRAYFFKKISSNPKIGIFSGSFFCLDPNTKSDDLKGFVTYCHQSFSQNSQRIALFLF